MTKYYWDVKLPEEGDYTREQGWAALSELESKLTNVVRRLNGLYDTEKSLLDKCEIRELSSLRTRLKVITDKIGKDVLERLASLSDDDDRKWAEIYGTTKYPREIRDVISTYHGDVSLYDRGGGDKAKLAFALLEQSDFEPQEIGEIIQKYMRPDAIYSDVWTCPRCDDSQLGKIDDEECKRCFGWGYVWSEEEPDDYDVTQAGRLALNHGEAWTPEQEAAEEARLKELWGDD